MDLLWNLMFRFQVKKNGFDVSLVKLLALSSFVCLCETEFQFCVECVSERERKREREREREREEERERKRKSVCVCVTSILARSSRAASLSFFLSFLSLIFRFHSQSSRHYYTVVGKSKKYRKWNISSQLWPSFSLWHSTMRVSCWQF